MAKKKRKPDASGSPRMTATDFIWAAAITALVFGAVYASQVSGLISTTSPAPASHPRKHEPAVTPQQRREERDADSEEACRERMERGDCEADSQVMVQRCAQTCKTTPMAARCLGWQRLGHCERVSAFMLANCAGTCSQDEVQCQRQPPQDLYSSCAGAAAEGGCLREWRRGNGYFVGACFQSCAKQDPLTLLEAMLHETMRQLQPHPSW